MTQPNHFFGGNGTTNFYGLGLDDYRLGIDCSHSLVLLTWLINIHLGKDLSAGEISFVYGMYNRYSDSLVRLG